MKRPEDRTGLLVEQNSDAASTGVDPLTNSEVVALAVEYAHAIDEWDKADGLGKSGMAMCGASAAVVLLDPSHPNYEQVLRTARNHGGQDPMTALLHRLNPARRARVNALRRAT